MFQLVLPDVASNLVLLFVRVILLVTFFAEARFKLKDIHGFAKSDGVPLPVAWLVAIAELLAALAMLAGFMTQWAGLGIALLMIGTTCLQLFKWHSPYWANKSGWEYDVIMFVLGTVMAVFGGGSFSLDAIFR